MESSREGQAESNNSTQAKTPPPRARGGSRANAASNAGVVGVERKSQERART